MYVATYIAYLKIGLCSLSYIHTYHTCTDHLRLCFAKVLLFIAIFIYAIYLECMYAIYGTAQFKLDAREHCRYSRLKLHVSRAHNHEHAFFANLHANEIPRE